MSQASAEEWGRRAIGRSRPVWDTQFSRWRPSPACGSSSLLAQTLADAGEVLTPVLDLGRLAGQALPWMTLRTLSSVPSTPTARVPRRPRRSRTSSLRITQLTNFATNDFPGVLSKAAANGAQFGTSCPDTSSDHGRLAAQREHRCVDRRVQRSASPSAEVAFREGAECRSGYWCRDLR